ncbi:alpha/beta fold hydrolase [Xiamenia xianingshaonis]|uniref:Alpha/beta fold hydrolase n=1 Tax=Xiamenia xianingshaonis TaxID=2682776 RepID=A0A9E6SUD9_9ACTN|nr:alpha/beta fold hydrolase [Xiamenia xianingshaonis]NHM13913.1 alpha/beta fold hydrolase [Xiamenia xianingshaonis]QTU84398.1 alpha/beta fold hydrolase [Xiamenia xianingshaonis]
MNVEGVCYGYRWWAPVAGRGSLPPVVLVHGFAQSAASWEAVARRLAEDRAVYALDLLGCGGSDCPEDPEAYSLTAQGQALAAFVRLVCGQAEGAGAAMFHVKPWVVGYSMGGRVVLAAAATDKAFSQLVGGIVLESAGLGPATKSDRAAAASADARHAAMLRTAGVEAFFAYWEDLPLFATQRDLPDDVRRSVAAERLAHDAEALARAFDCAGQHCMPARDRTLETLQRLVAAKIPVCYLAGQLDRKYAAVAADLKAALPAVAVRIIPDAGHNTHLENPEGFLSAWV